MSDSAQKKYAQDGVNVAEGDSFSEFAGALCRQTYQNSPFVEIRDFSLGHFRGPRAFRLKNLPKDCWMDIAPDGDGTKVVLVDAARDYDNAAYGWVAMTCGDITRWGGIPLILVNNLDTKTLGKSGDPTNNAFRRMMLSLKRIADQEGLVMYKGETAELPGCITSPNPKALTKYTWSGVAFGAYNAKTVITGDQVQSDMAIMGLRELGMRNNGISSLRKALKLHYGSGYYYDSLARETVKQAATHAALYDRFLVTANGWFNKCVPLIKMYLIVHLTGGALKGKLAEDILFPRELSAELDNLWNPPQIMCQAADWRGMDDEECYETWNGGQGALVVIDSKDIRQFISLARQFSIQAKWVGKITKRKGCPAVTIKSKFRGKKTIWWSAY